MWAEKLIGTLILIVASAEAGDNIAVRATFLRARGGRQAQPRFERV
jgi:hypothetical protein